MKEFKNEQEFLNDYFEGIRQQEKPRCCICKFYDSDRRNENGQARCTKHPFWVKDTDVCDSYESGVHFDWRMPPTISNPKVEPKANESQIKVIIKHSIIFVVCFLAMALIYSWTSEKTWGWEWDIYPTKCFIGLFLFLIPAIIGIVCLIKISKIIISNIISLYKLSIRYKERCYKKIDRLHSYLERGSITQEEFNELKQSILDAMEK